MIFESTTETVLSEFSRAETWTVDLPLKQKMKVNIETVTYLTLLTVIGSKRLS